MISIVRTIFSRLHVLDSAAEEAKLLVNEEEPQHGEITMSLPTNSTDPSGLSSQESGEVTLAERENAISDNIDDSIVAGDEALPQTPSTSRPCKLPHLVLCASKAKRNIDGLPALLELLRVLVNILDPNDQVHTDSTRLTALVILNAALETSGTIIGDYPSLSGLILDPGCKYLFQLARSDNASVLQASLRTITTVFQTMRKHLKLQQELFLAFSIDRLAAPPQLKPLNSKRNNNATSPRLGTPATGTPILGPVDTELELDKGSPGPSRPPVQPARGDTRDLMLETLSQLCRHPSSMVDLYVNYDCDINCENLFERLIEFLTKVGRYGKDYALTADVLGGIGRIPMAILFSL